MEKLIDIRKTADLMGVSINSVRNYMKKMGLKAYRVGGRNLKFRVSEIQDFVTASRVKQNYSGGAVTPE